jgi:hypothetical protein
MLFELFSIEGEHPRAPKAIVRRFILWSIVCWVSAGPAFGLAISMGGNGRGQHFSPWAMAMAIVLFTTLYTLFTSTDAFDRFHRIRGVRRTLYIGYWTRMGLSVALPVGMVVDMVTGIVSIQAVTKALHLESSFVTTFLITCLHGTLMNLLIAIYMAMLYPLVLRFSRDRPQPRGFEVIMPVAMPAESLSTRSPELPADRPGA